MINKKNMWLMVLLLVIFTLIGCHDRSPVDPDLDSMLELGRGIYVNPSQYHPLGLDSLTLNTGDTTMININSILLDDPNYTFSADNAQMLQIEQDSEDSELFYFIALGDSGSSTVLKITDSANAAEKIINIGINDHWASEDYFSFLGTFEGHYYYLSTHIRSWVNAEEFCRQSGGYLACINSSEENEFLDNGRGRQDNVWVGLRFNPIGDVVDDDWELETWVNGDSLIYQNFVSKPSEPGIFAEYYFHMVDTGKWENWHEISYPYFMEME